MKVRNDRHVRGTSLSAIAVAFAAWKSKQTRRSVLASVRTLSGRRVVDAEKTRQRLAKFASTCDPIILDRSVVAFHIEIDEPPARPTDEARENLVSLSIGYGLVPSVPAVRYERIHCLVINVVRPR